MKKLCTFVSLEDSTAHIRDDIMCREHLQAHGWDLQEWPWTQNHPWEKSDAVVFRSCYDYWERLPEFRKFLAYLDELSVPVFNSIESVRWNMDKSYLFQLGESGIPVIPSQLVNTMSELKEAVNRFPGTEIFVVKPCIGAGGFEQIQFSRDDVETVNFQGKWLFQPYLPSIQDGEWSAIFFNNLPSHAVVKRAKAGEYRVQDSHGGKTEACELSTPLLEASKRVLETIATLGVEKPLYSRLDFVTNPGDGSLLLMEIELLEPTLFFAHSPGSAERFAEALVSRIG